MDIPTPKTVYCTVSDRAKGYRQAKIPTRREAVCLTKAFTHKTAENAKPGDKPYKLSTGRGFYLLVMPTGGKLWRYDYRFDGKRKTAALGSFPDVSRKKRRRNKPHAGNLLSRALTP